MGLCAYCNQDKPLTREHVIPDWYVKIYQSPDAIAYLERSPKKFIDSAATKKDVCADCNNGALATLDAYGKELYEKYFSKFIYADETPEFSYNYQYLIKWLLKCSYNSARVHNTDLEVLEGYKNYFITDDPLPNGLVVYCSSLAPPLLLENGSPQLASRSDENDVEEHNLFRLGIFRLNDFDTRNWCFRSVIINSYVFYLCVPKLSAQFIKQKRKLMNAASKSDFISDKLLASGQMTMSAPVMDYCSSYANHMQANPLAYDLLTDNISKHVQQGDYDIVIYSIFREDIESGNTEEIESFLYNISNSREIALVYMQRIEFVIDGYNDDPRELYEIDEVVRYLGKLNKVFPYWLFFQSEMGNWLNVLFFCLTINKVIKQNGQPNLVEFDPKRVGRFMENWFLGLNKLCHRCGIGETLNRKISKDFIGRLRKFIPIPEVLN